MRLKDGIDENIGQFKYLDKDTIITPFFTNKYCDYLIDCFEKTGWSGGYDSPSFQKTTEVDACALSDCLASALQHYVESETILESEFSLLTQEIVSQVKEFCALGSFRILPDSNGMS